MEINGIEIQYVHAANSAGAMMYKDSHFNMVRPGLMLYGLYPNPDRTTIAITFFINSSPPHRILSTVF